MIDEETEAKVLDAMRLILRACREEIDITLRADGKVLVGVPIATGSQIPKWLTNGLLPLNDKIVTAGLAAVGSARLYWRLSDATPEVVEAPIPKSALN